MAKEKIAIIAGAVVELIGFILLYIGYKNGNDPFSYAGVTLALGGGIVLWIADYIDKHGSLGTFPIKKVLVCAAMLFAGIMVGVLFASAASNATGWVPVGNEFISAAIPICLSIAACIWYWQNHD